LNQTDQDFDIYIWCGKHHGEIFRNLHPKIKTFRATYDKRDSHLFIDYTSYDRTIGLPKDSIQVGLDSDDLLEPEFVERIKRECVGDKSIHISFQPTKYDIRANKEYIMDEYTLERGSPIFAIYQPEYNYFAYHTSHLRLPRFFDEKRIISGYTKMSIHQLNDSTGIKKSDKLIHCRLSLFTNCYGTDLETIKNTHKSFVETFGDIPKTVYLDPRPREDLFDEYRKHLESEFGRVVKTESLSDGYIKSIDEATTPYLFQLEHDWKFQNITHTLDEIIDLMRKDQIYHFRFSKLINHHIRAFRKWQSYILEKGDKIKYCETDNLSNNPHIIEVKKYRDIRWMIKKEKGSMGIEQNLTRKGLVGCQYGGLDYPPTIVHTSHLHRKVRAFFLDDLNNNCGDMLTKPILEHFGFEVRLVDRNEKGKWLGVGSIMSALRDKDTVWGSGCIRYKKIKRKDRVKFLAVRGPITKSLTGANTDVFGDPALLLPLVYNPEVEQKYEVGLIPHYIDKPLVKVNDEHFIDIQSDWKNVVREIKKCKKIISSSLHGLVIAEAYGIPAIWVKYSDNIIGGEMKFHDYLLGTGREAQSYGELPPIKDIKSIQDRLIEALNEGIKNGT
jgi:pyruvyltransferase